MLLTFFYKKLLKILLVRYLLLVKRIYRFGLFSKGFYCLLFNVLFCSSVRNDSHYTIPFFVCQYFFDIFSKKFICTIKSVFRQNKKLVIIVLFYSLCYILLLIPMYIFCFFVCCKVLFYNSIFFSLSQ